MSDNNLTLQEQWKQGKDEIPYWLWLEREIFQLKKQSYTVGQIKAAFWATFHKGGDVRFETDDNTESVWIDFEVQLNKTKE